MTAQKAENGAFEVFDVPREASTTSADPDFRFPKRYLAAVRAADLGAELARYADDAGEWAEAVLPVAGVQDVEW